jgi:hypothetical protein
MNPTNEIENDTEDKKEVVFNFEDIKESIEQMNNFQRAAKKKSSLKTGKTTAKELQERLKVVDPSKLKKIKFNNINLNIEPDSKSMTNRKLLNEKSKTSYREYKGDDEYLNRLNDINKQEATEEIIKEVEKKVNTMDEEHNSPVAKSTFIF